MLEPLHSRNPLTDYTDQPQPLSAYALLLGLYGTALVGLLARFRRHQGWRSWRMSAGDVLLLGVATHRLSRLLASDAVTSPLRAPFTRYQGPRSGGEVSEVPRGQGLQRVLGELLTSSISLAPWVATGLTLAHAWRPNEARLVGTLFTLADLSDFLQRSYAWLGAGLQRTQALARAVEVSEGPLRESPAH